MTPTPLKSTRLAVAFIFGLNGALIANWVSRIPAVKGHLALNDAELGVALLGLAVGALVAFSVAGWSVSRFGARPVIMTGLLLMCVALPVIALAPNLPLLALTLFVLGAGNGATDVAMNAQAVEVEKAYGKPILSSFHAMWSLGALLGAGLGGLLAAANLTPFSHFVLVAVAVALAAMLVRPHLLQTAPRAAAGPVFSWPPRSLLGVGLIVFGAAVGEGAVADWSAVYLRDELGTGAGFAAIGYASFAVAMLVARLLGDTLTAHWGAVRVAAQGGLVAALGLSFGLLVATPWAVLIGFACVGWGLASAFPLAFGAAGNMPGLEPGVALAAVATMGYTGFLLGPPLIGFVAHATSLRLALSAVVVFSLMMAVLSTSLRPDTQEGVSV